MRTTPSFRSRSLTALFALSIVTGLLGNPAQAADGDPTTSNLMSQPVVPYEGFLMLDGAPMTGTHWMRFDLWGDSSSNAEAQLRYSETQPVQFFNGRFSVGIGDGTSITIGTRTPTVLDTILDGDRLYLGLHIGGPVEGTTEPPLNAYVSLSGRQRIEAVPYSAWSASAADMTVARVLKSNYFLPTYGNWPPPNGEDTGGAAIINDNGTYQALMIVGNNSGGGSTRRIEMFDDVDVGSHLSSGSFTTRGQASAASFSTSGAVTAGSVSATGQVSGGSVSTTGAVSAGSVSAGSVSTTGNVTVGGAITFGGGRGTVTTVSMGNNSQWGTQITQDCPANQFVCGLTIWDEPQQGNGDDTGVNQIILRCCPLSN